MAKYHEKRMALVIQQAKHALQEADAFVDENFNNPSEKDREIVRDAVWLGHILGLKASKEIHQFMDENFDEFLDRVCPACLRGEHAQCTDKRRKVRCACAEGAHLFD